MSSFHPTASVVALSFALMLICCASFAADYYVATTAGSDTTGTGSQAAPWATIQHTINTVTGTASDPADIHVAAGTYRENLVMKDYVNLWGGYEATTWARDTKANGTVVDGGGQGSSVRFESVASGSLDGFIITNGSGHNDQGGGIFCSHSSPIIRNNIVKDNSVYGADAVGGGIYCFYSSPKISDNIIGGNSAESDEDAFGGDGGGIYCANCSPTIENNVVISNWAASYGGGIYCDNASPIIRKNIISTNEAYNVEIGAENGDDGGGIFCDNNSSPLIESNIITRNFANVGGGGIASYNSSPSIRNNLIIHNTALGGGAIYYSGSSPTIQNNSIISNTAYYHPIWEDGRYGGGIFGWRSSPLIENNLFYKNDEYDVYEYDSTTARYNNFYGGLPGFWYDADASTRCRTIDQVNALADAEDNVSVPPGFRPSFTGIITGITYDPTRFQSTLTHSSAVFTPGVLAGLILNTPPWPDGLPIVSNTGTTITVWGDLTNSVSVGDSYSIFDYHLRSTSPLIDAGMDVGTGHLDIDGEVRPCGARFDIGTDEHCAQGEGEEEEPWFDEGWEGIGEPWLYERRVEIEESILPDEAGEDEEEERKPDEIDVEIEEQVHGDEAGEGEDEAKVEVDDETENGREGEGENQELGPISTPTPPTINLCPVARATASTTLAARLDWLRDWRDTELLETRIAETIAATYYRIKF